MASFDDESKSDGLEILSVGALYTGTWDKKYWSSSRGKDRYPYPIGYQALRTHKGLTYKMEIHEGSKGPKFQITSNDNQLGSGETPDRACENFQKNCCSRIKLWHGKRSSGKIDGVEFFGFKNALVQRLLRELVATVNDACDQSSVLTNCNEAPSEVHNVGKIMTCEIPDLRSHLEKATVTGKRSRPCRGASTKSTCKSGYRRCQPPHQVDPTVLYPAPGKMDANKPLVSCALSDFHDEGAMPILSEQEPGASVSSSAPGLTIKSDGAHADHKVDPGSIPVLTENPSMENCASVSSLGMEVLEEVKSFDRQSIEIQGVGCPVTTKEDQKDRVLPDLLERERPAQGDSKVNLCDELCAPDSLDNLQEMTSAQNCGSHGGEAAMARNEAAADSFYSEESEFDSVEDIAKSMMAVLLPRAIPLLKYTSRKKRKIKSQKDSSCASKPENNQIEASLSADIKSSADIHACSALDGQVKVPPSSVYIDSGPSVMENIRLIVPDSLDKDQYEDNAVNESPPSFANIEAVNLQETREPDNGEINETSSSAYQNETAGFTENVSHEDLKNCDRMSLIDCIPALQSAVPCLSSVPPDLVAASEDQCFNADVNSKPTEISCKKTDPENLPDSTGRYCASPFREDEAKINSNCLDKRELNDEIESTMKFIGCYSHPMRVSSVMLTRSFHEIYICVSCGLLEERQRDLFLYKLSTKEPCLGSPCMVGHTSMSLPSWKDEYGRELAVDKSGLQFTPDARSLVLADSIRVPYCREKNLHCLCPHCESCCFAENAVKIVQIKLGFVSLVLKLNTIFPVQCVLVCEPEHLIAVDESGRIYIWIMNSNWSVQTEVYVIPSNDFLPSRVVEMKRIPKSASMVVGHNGYGEFSLWDIVKRTVVSRFSAPTSSVFDFLPVSLFSWASKALAHDKHDLEGFVRKLKEANMLSRHGEANMSGPSKGEDFAVWLLICTSPDSGAQSVCHSSNNDLNSNGCWRLGLLIKDTVILGAALESSMTAIGSTSGTGIIGTPGGQVYVWDLATGSKVETLHDLEGNGVLHVATDDTTSSVVAIAGEGGQLYVYLCT